MTCCMKEICKVMKNMYLDYVYGNVINIYIYIYFYHKFQLINQPLILSSFILVSPMISWIVLGVNDVLIPLIKPSLLSIAERESFVFGKIPEIQHVSGYFLSSLRKMIRLPCKNLLENMKFLEIILSFTHFSFSFVVNTTHEMVERIEPTMIFD